MSTKLADRIGDYSTDRLGRRLSPGRLNRRAKIMTGTLQLVADRGYDAVTVDELAAAGGVSKKTLYDIYGSKQAVVAQAVALRLDMVVDSIDEELSGGGLDRLRTTVTMTVRAVLDTPELSRALAPMLVKSADEFHLIAFFEKLHRRALERMKDDGELHGWVNIDFTARSMMFEQIAVQNMWSGGNIADDQYEGFALLSLYRLLAPLAKASLRKDLVNAIRLLQADLSFTSEGAR